MSIQCEMIGRYVTIYNERLPEQTYPDYYSSTAELELCEVEVYGKCSIIITIVEFWLALLHIKLVVCIDVNLLFDFFKGCQGISQYGDYCLTCPSTCPDARCNMSTGSCFHCSNGFTGDNCTESMYYLFTIYILTSFYHLQK